MDQIKIGKFIQERRKEKRLTQSELAEKLDVTDRAVSKWETGKGYPDITLIEQLSGALGISALELLSGDSISNTNRAFNMSKVKFYVCPICGNIISATGETVISCCGITLPPLEAEEADDIHEVTIEQVEDEYFVSLQHEMTKEHYISFIAALSDNGIQMVKLYPEGNAEARFKINKIKKLLWYCNRHGLFAQKISRIK